MTRAYIRVLPDLYRRKALGICDDEACHREHAPYPPAALGAFLGLLCLAETQTPRGRFSSRKVLEGLLEGADEQGVAYAEQIDFLIKQGDLVIRPDRSLYVEGWNELQEGDWQVAERMRRYRTRKNPDAKPIADIPETDDPAVAYMHVIGSFPRGKAIEWINDLTQKFGAAATRAEIAKQSEAGTDGLLGRVSDALRMQEHLASKREREEEARKVEEGHKVRNNVTLLTARHNTGMHVEERDPRCPLCQEAAA